MTKPFHRTARSIRSRAVQPLARAILVVSAVAVLATGVTYAALQSPTATLTGNSITTANADLKIGTSTTYSATKAGFSFTGLIPGGPAMPVDGNSFFLKNSSTGSMALRLSLAAPPVNAANVDMAKVYVVLSRADTSTTQKISLANLIASQTTGGVALTDNLAGGAIGVPYKIQVLIDDDAFTGQTAVISGIDLVFTGTVVSPVVAPVN